MQSLLKRLLRSANISAPYAASTFNISSLDKFIETACVNTLSRLLADPAHPLAKKLSKSTRTTRAFPFKTGKYNSNAYRDSFVQSTLRILRDGQRDMYIPSTTSTRASQPKPPTSTAPHFSPAPKVSKAASITCLQCKRVCKSNAGLASHLRVHRRTTTNT